MTEKISIFRYQSAKAFLKDSIKEKKKSPEFSIRKFCKDSNFGSHALLVMILNGRRKLTLKHVPPLAKALELGSEEKLYFQTLIKWENATTEEEKSLFRLWLSDLQPQETWRVLELETDQYQVIADWIHMAILSLCEIEGAKITAPEISRLIRRKVPMQKIQEAIDRLTSLGFLKNEDGKWKQSFQVVTTRDDVANKGAREYHKQVARLAIEAVEEQAPEIREFQSFACPIPREKVPLAKELIRKFRHQFIQAMMSEPGYEIYQCNLHFFKIVDHPKTE